MNTLNTYKANPEKELIISWIANKYQNYLNDLIKLNDKIRVLINDNGMIIKNSDNKRIAINPEIAAHIGIKEV